MANMENSHMENDRIENAHHGKRPKKRHWKMAKNAYPEIARTEFKFTYWKMAENTHLENGRTENAQHGK